MPECPHHVTQRGNERRDVFFTPTDREVYLGLLKQYAQLYAVDILGYCLMSNHVHLVLLPHQAESMSKLLKHLQMRYCQYRHALERGSGHLWQGRYYSCAVDPERLACVMRYVELNPVRAAMVKDAEEYEWSSAAVHLGAWDVRGLLALDDWTKCWSPVDWRLVLQGGVEDSVAIREATYGGRPLGSTEFVQNLGRFLQRPLQKRSPGRPKKEVVAVAGG
jgi:putative transposase